MEARKAKRPKTTACGKCFGRPEADEPPVEQVPGVRAGYVGKAKGLKDVLFERGRIDPAVNYTMDGNSTGKKKSESLKAIISNCEDFKEETTAMHDLAALLGVEMDKTPKGHPELAGRGVEYCWGTAGGGCWAY